MKVMAMTAWIMQRFQQFDQQLIAVNAQQSVSYQQFSDKIAQWQLRIEQWQINTGDRVGLVCDYHIDVVALLQALLLRGCIVIPLSEDDRAMFDERLTVCAANVLLTVPTDRTIAVDSVQYQRLEPAEQIHSLMQPLLQQQRAGLVIFTSGSTGKGKAVLLDYQTMIEKFQHKVRPAFRTLLFLKLDLEVLATMGC